MIETPQLPPHNLGAEQSVLGAVLLDNRTLAIARDVLVEEDFYVTSHQKIFRTMAELSDAGKVIDQITLTERLKAQGQLESIGGAAYIAELWHEVPSAANVASHAQIVRDHAGRRRAIADARHVMDAAYGEVPLAELVKHIERLRVPLGSGSVSAPADSPLGTFSPMSVPQLFDDPEPFQPTWVWEEFLPEGGLAGLIAKPKVGMTTNAYELAVKVAQGLPYLGRATRRGPVLILAIEEHRREVKRRLRNLGADQLTEIHVHIGPLPASADTFRQLKTYIAAHGIILVIFDTLNSFWSVRDENDAVAMTQAIKPILSLARESVAAILLLHHARKSEGKFGDEIRGSGALFSLLDVALILKRHEVETQRKLTAISRYPETPSELIIELREHGHEALGDPATVGKAAKASKVRAALTDIPTLVDDIGKRAGVSRMAAYPILEGVGRRTVTVQASYAKSGQTRTVSLNSVMLAALNRLPNRSEFVFAKPNGKPYHAIRGFRAACHRAGLTGVTPHSTRHTFATRLVENGVDLRTVQELGGWATLSLIQRYAHVSPSRKAEAVEGLVRNSTTGLTTLEKHRIGNTA